MLGVDEAVMMPTGGGEKRAEAMATLAEMAHETVTAPAVFDWIVEARGEDLDAMQSCALNEFEREYRNLTCLSGEFINRQVRTRMRSEQLWRELRPAGDWQAYLPALEDVVDLAREEAARRADASGLAPYDAMMEQYDPGNRLADIMPMFESLRRFLKDFIPKALDAQEKRHTARPLRTFNAPYSIEKQKALGLLMMEAVGFDFDHGRLDVSHHPFCGGVPTDVRMTTRYTEAEFLSSLMGILHETGHGLYEQNLPLAWNHWPLGRARGMTLHESQSLFVEKQLACSPEFWTWALPHVREVLGPEAIPGWDIEDLLARVQLIEPGFIRVDADEATYPLHVILRFEIEKALIEGEIQTRDIPALWDEKMQAYLGLSTRDTMKDGPMQDVHWPSGAFGYFPSYTLGAMTAAQIMAAIERDQPEVREDIRHGRFVAVNAWRKTHIWQEGSRYSTPDLLSRATGEKLNARYFEDHLTRRYLGA
jgi:carboxypeptidase Taq